MRNILLHEGQESEVMDYTPTTPYEAHQRIEKAERGIANGEVVAHEHVIKHSYDLLAKKVFVNSLMQELLNHC